MRAVIFDLWQTLAAWSTEDMAPLFAAAGLTPDEWMAAEHRDRRWTAPFVDWVGGLGLPEDAARRAVELRVAMTRRSLVPVEGALAVLEELRGRGLRLGLISNCSSDVADAWEGSPFAGRFDAVVLSAEVGMCKPAPQIYRLALDRLGVEPADAIFVGDGDSRELPGAAAVGIRAVCLGSRDDWRGETIQSLPDLLALVPNGGER